MQPTQSLKEIDEYLKKQGLELFVHNIDTYVDQRIVGQRFELTITASGFCATPVDITGINNGKET